MKNTNNNLNNKIQNYNSEAGRTLELVMRGQPINIYSYDAEMLKVVANDNEPQQLFFDFEG